MYCCSIHFQFQLLLLQSAGDVVQNDSAEL